MSWQHCVCAHEYVCTRTCTQMCILNKMWMYSKIPVIRHKWRMGGARYLKMLVPDASGFWPDAEWEAGRGKAGGSGHTEQLQCGVVAAVAMCKLPLPLCPAGWPEIPVNRVWILLYMGNSFLVPQEFSWVWQFSPQIRTDNSNFWKCLWNKKNHKLKITWCQTNYVFIY